MSKLLEGYYKATDTFYQILRVGHCSEYSVKSFWYRQNENGKFTALDAIDSEYPMRVEYGDFGEAAEDVQKESGIINYNVKLTISFMDDKEEEEEKKE